MLGCIYEPAQQLRNEDENVEESEIRIILNAKYSKRKILRSRKGLTLQVHHLIREKIENTEVSIFRAFSYIFDNYTSDFLIRSDFILRLIFHI